MTDEKELIEKIARILCRKATSAFEATESLPDDNEVDFEVDFSAREQLCFRDVACAVISAIDLPSIKAAARAEAMEEAAKVAEKYAPFRGYSIEKNSDYGWATARERIAESIRALAKPEIVYDLA
jgi:hypothetical protein